MMLVERFEYREEGVSVLGDEGGLDLRQGASVDEREEEKDVEGSNVWFGQRFLDSFIFRFASHVQKFW